MSRFTKNAIIATFIDLLGEKPLSKITVTDIVTRCGVNRNTFYYYFQDIYAVLDELLLRESQKILDAGNNFESWQEGLIEAAAFALNNKKAIFHIYNSLSRQQLEKYFNTITDSVLRVFVKSQAEGLSVPEEDIDLISRFYTYALTGMIFEWLNKGMPYDVKEYIRHIGDIFEGNVKTALIRCSIKT